MQSYNISNIDTFHFNENITNIYTQWTFQGILPNSAKIIIDFYLYKVSQEILFADQLEGILPDTIKVTVTIQKWQFESTRVCLYAHKITCTHHTTNFLPTHSRLPSLSPLTHTHTHTLILFNDLELLGGNI